MLRAVSLLGFAGRDGCFEFLLTQIKQLLPFLDIGSPLRFIEVLPRLAPVIVSIGILFVHSTFYAECELFGYNPAVLELTIC